MMEAAQIKWLLTEGTCSPHICTSFKQISVQKEISSLKDADGCVKTAWEDLANITRNHFINLLGRSNSQSEVAIQKVLAAQTQRILEEARNAMEANITIEELHQAAKTLAKGPVPGKDGVPIEFCLHL